jgi:hypothetical protein
MKILTLSLREKSKSNKQQAESNGIFFLLVSSMDSSSILKMEAVRSHETSVNFYKTIQHHIPKGCTFENNNRVVKYKFLLI